jgi:hypothetical protein
MTSAEATLRDALRDRYVLEREPGRGRMGTVWLAHDLRDPVRSEPGDPRLHAGLGLAR